MTKMKSILLGTTFTLGLLAIPGGIAFAGEDQATTPAGATVTAQKTIEIIEPLTQTNFNTVDPGEYIYIGDEGAVINPGDLSINTSAYVEVASGASFVVDTFTTKYGHTYTNYPVNVSGRTGWDANNEYKLPVIVRKSATGFDDCPAGLVYLSSVDDNGTHHWKYSCSGGYVNGLDVQAFVVGETTADITITMNAPEYILRNGETLEINKNDIASVKCTYTYDDVEKEYTFPDNQISISSGEIKDGKNTITIDYGINGQVEVVVPVTYEVSYDLLGGKWASGEEASQFVPYGETATAPTAIPVREGFKFEGWSTTPGGEVIDFTTTKIEGLTTLYPVWSEGAATKDAEVINTDGKEALITAAGINNDAKELTNNLLTEEEKALLRQGQNSNIFLTVEDIKDTVSEEQMTQIKSIMEEDAVLGVVLDLNLYKQIGQNNPVQITNTEGNMVSITIAVDEKLINLDDTIQRDYYIIRVHDGEVTKIPVVFDPVAKTITFETDKFSLYALSYVDSAVPVAVPTVEAPPQTGDPIMTFMMMAALASGVAAVAVVLRKRTTTNE